jgi:hypothetical protein
MRSRQLPTLIPSLTASTPSRHGNSHCWEHLECISDDDRRLQELLSSGNLKFTLASDGGARDDLGSFGWEITIADETLWQCKGPTFGARPGSFLAESYGFLSALLFLQACSHYFDTAVDPNLTHDFYCDSESLLKRIRRALNRSWVNPSHCLSSDFDLESAHDHLPTRRHMHRIKKASHDKCPASMYITETAWHILSCPSRSLWRAEMLRTLGESLITNRTQPDIALILLQGICGALSNHRFQMNPDNREPSFRALVNSQNKIGWHQLLNGRFSKQWTQIQDQHLLDDIDNDHEKQSGDRWLKLTLHHMWTHLWKVWLNRNDDLHGHENDEKERKRIEQLRFRVLALHSKHDLLLACDKPIFDMPIDEPMKLKSGELSTWVRLVTATIKRAIADAEQHLHDTNHSITAFLATARPDPLTTDKLVNELRPVPRMRPWIPLSTNFSFLFRVASPLAHANCAHAAHTGLSQV